MKRRIRPQYRQKVRWPKWLIAGMSGLWWVLLVALVLIIEPQRLQNVAISGLYLPLILLVFLALSWTIYLLKRRFWPSVLWAMGVSLFLILRLYGWGNGINFAIIGLSLIILEIYWRWTQKNNPRLPETLEPDQTINI